MYENLPQKLKELEPFCLWKNENGRKIPYQATGKRADPSDPSTFSSFENIIAACDSNYDGIGVLTTALTKIKRPFFPLFLGYEEERKKKPYLVTVAITVFQTSSFWWH